MNYTCEKCEADLDEDTDAVMIIKRPNVDALAYCLDSVACAEAGADIATIAARREAAGIKSEVKPSGDPD